ncbi:glutathione S-transferase [Penicillium antarcticum]|uniref:glutathione S-transferase n=1 Tax=Penicillium antarcticum TaxID=416450 RepID=UPI00239991E5|nr:glutathione S-transferase [Penicillium antarcticum]KAJ5295249.1 glutathione S-transferase [Penicillium antarcticum]
MAMKVHHLCRSQSARVVWLCEALGIPYNLHPYDSISPRAISQPPLAGTARIITDSPVVLAETGAIFEYILTKYGNGKLSCANGSLQPGLINLMFSRMNTEANPAEDIGAQVSQKRVDVNFKEMDTRLAESPYLAGEEFTAADCMTVFSLTTLRTFAPFGLEFYPHIVKYLERISQRAGYQSLMAKAEPGMEPAILATAPQGILAC